MCLISLLVEGEPGSSSLTMTPNQISTFSATHVLAAQRWLRHEELWNGECVSCFSSHHFDASASQFVHLFVCSAVFSAKDEILNWASPFLFPSTATTVQVRESGMSSVFFLCGFHAKSCAEFLCFAPTSQGAPDGSSVSHPMTVLLLGESAAQEKFCVFCVHHSLLVSPLFV